MHAIDPNYEPLALETKWQKIWLDSQAFAPKQRGEPFYALEMFPYPSGDMHMGHVRNYTIGDVFARFARAQGRDVLHPMGWDALGLPAENQAIREKIAPQVRTPKNIAQMRTQMQRLGLSYDWSREFATYESSYYRWNQWFFLQFLKKDWVYRRQSTVNWCDGCDTVLANEQVRDDGTCWRGHPNVTTRSIPEWAFRITAFADELLEGIDTLKAWPDRVTHQQRHWIGKSTGAKIRFDVVDATHHLDIFTTRVDTIYGCTYVVLAPEHPLAEALATPQQKAAVTAFIRQMRQEDRIARTAVGGEKAGVFTGTYVTHPFTKKPVPLWLANFVLADYGTGAVMSVPAHDARDFDFAKKYGLPLTPVITPEGSALPDTLIEAFTSDGILHQSGPFSGLTSAQAREKMAAHADGQGFGSGTVNWHLRDWGFSRQRYWGTPIPVVYCDKDGVVPLPESDLPVVLPDFSEVRLSGQGGAPLAKLESFVQTTCPQCQGPARREVETMDTFVDSAWYFARFLSPHDATQPFDPALARHWLPVDVYVGGPEHAVMHLLYFRFWTKAMKVLGLVDVDEPVKRLVTQGMVNALAFRCVQHGYVPAKAMRALPEDQRICPTCNKPLVSAIEKMSKSKFNGVDPLEMIERYGTDAARLYSLFAAPPEKDLEWSHEGLEGLYRFVNRIWRLLAAQAPHAANATATASMAGLTPSEKAVRQALHRTLDKVTFEMENRNHFNTAIAAMMELVNTLHEHKLQEGAGVQPGLANEVLCVLAQMLAPFAPHLAEEMWHVLGRTGLVGDALWPQVDPAALVQESVTIAVQVNGKLRGQIAIAPQAPEPDVVQQAEQDENVARHLTGKKIVKRIFVAGRLLNFVVRDA